MKVQSIKLGVSKKIPHPSEQYSMVESSCEITLELEGPADVNAIAKQYYTEICHIVDENNRRLTGQKVEIKQPEAKQAAPISQKTDHLATEKQLNTIEKILKHKKLGYNEKADWYQENILNRFNIKGMHELTSKDASVIISESFKGNK